MWRLLTAAILLCNTGAYAACPTAGVAPRTAQTSAASFLNAANFSLDKDGILVFDYGQSYGGIGKYRNPFFITDYANALYKDYLATQCRDEDLKDKFLLQADFLRSSAEWNGEMAVWRYHFSNNWWKLDAGWISGVGQSRIAGVLERAFALTGIEDYERYANAAMKVYERSLTEGGVATTDGPVTWFEEYPDPKGRSFKILNGHITAVAGILDFYALTGKEKWKNLAERGIAAVKRDIAKYDAGFTTYYSADAPELRPIAAIGQQYNSLHVDQMLWLYSITKDAFFLKWASRLQAYELNSDVYTASHSIDLVTNGPSQAKALYGSAYWSDGTFPTWLEIKLPEVASLSGFWIDASGQLAAPKDFSISAKIDGEWRTIEEIKGNTGTRRVIKFQSEVVTDMVRLNIADDNGNHTVAIQAAMPIRATPQFAAITNDCNYLTGGGSYNYNLAMDDDPHSSMVVYCPGWVVIPTHGKSRLTLSGSGKENARFKVSASEGFDSWIPVQTVAVTREGVNVDLPHTKFARITFGQDVARIDQIKLQ